MSGPSSMRTPLGRVRNLGSSHSGTTDFWRQRLTAVAMTLLIVPVIVIVLMLIGRNQAGAAQILGSLPIAIILVLFITPTASDLMSGPSSMRTPLGRVRNLGSSHSGTTDFWRQRLTAVAMTLLIVPVIVIVLMLIGRNQAGAAQILGSLPIAIILVLFIIASA